MADRIKEVESRLRARLANLQRDADAIEIQMETILWTLGVLSIKGDKPNDFIEDVKADAVRFANTLQEEIDALPKS